MKKKDLILKLKRQLKRSREIHEKIAESHKGRESELTYWAGREKGCFEEKIYLLADIIDYIEELES